MIFYLKFIPVVLVVGNLEGNHSFDLAAELPLMLTENLAVLVARKSETQDSIILITQKITIN